VRKHLASVAGRHFSPKWIGFYELTWTWNGYLFLLIIRRRESTPVPEPVTCTAVICKIYNHDTQNGLNVDGNFVLAWHGLHSLTKRRSRINLSWGILSKKSKIVVKAGKLYSFKFLYGLFFKLLFPVTPKIRPLTSKLNNRKAKWRKRQLSLTTGTSSQF